MTVANALRVSALAAAISTAPAFSAVDKTLEHADKVLEYAKTTLSQAVTTAESEAGGKALSAGLSRQHGKDFYAVHVLKGTELTDVRVGLEDGKVISTHPMHHGHTAKAKAAPQQPQQQPSSKG